MRKILLIYFILIVCLHGKHNPGYCQQSGDHTKHLIYSFERAEPLKMSEIISDISYIQLETNPECLIGYMNLLYFGQNIILRTADENESIYRFSLKGKYLNKIGKKGRGPNEYQNCSDVRLIGDTVYVLSGFTKSILCYSLAGNLIKRYQIDINTSLKTFIQLSDESFLFSLYSSNNLGQIIKTDKVFNIESRFMKNIPVDNNPLPIRFQSSDDKILYCNPFHNIIWDVSTGHPIPEIILEYKKFRISDNRLSNDPKYDAMLNNPYIIDFNANK